MKQSLMAVSLYCFASILPLQSVAYAQVANANVSELREKIGDSNEIEFTEAYRGYYLIDGNPFWFELAGTATGKYYLFYYDGLPKITKEYNENYIVSLEFEQISQGKSCKLVSDSISIDRCPNGASIDVNYMIGKNRIRTRLIKVDDITSETLTRVKALKRHKIPVTIANISNHRAQFDLWPSLPNECKLNSIYEYEGFVSASYEAMRDMMKTTETMYPQNNLYKSPWIKQSIDQMGAYDGGHSANSFVPRGYNSWYWKDADISNIEKVRNGRMGELQGYNERRRLQPNEYNIQQVNKYLEAYYNIEEITNFHNRIHGVIGDASKMAVQASQEILLNVKPENIKSGLAANRIISNITSCVKVFNENASDLPQLLSAQNASIEKIYPTVISKLRAGYNSNQKSDEIASEFKEINNSYELKTLLKSKNEISLLDSLNEKIVRLASSEKIAKDKYELERKTGNLPPRPLDIANAMANASSRANRWRVSMYSVIGVYDEQNVEEGAYRVVSPLNKTTYKYEVSDIACQKLRLRQFRCSYAVAVKIGFESIGLFGSTGLDSLDLSSLVPKTRNSATFIQTDDGEDWNSPEIDKRTMDAVIAASASTRNTSNSSNSSQNQMCRALGAGVVASGGSSDSQKMHSAAGC